MFHQYIHPSFIVNQNLIKNSENNFTTLSIDNCENDEEELIKGSVIHSINFSNKLVDYCELSGIKLKEEEESKNSFLVSSYIRGYKNITYFPRGIIFHSNKEEEKLEMANLFFESNYNLIIKHTFNSCHYDNYCIKVNRSDGTVSDGWFKEEYGLIYSKNNDRIFIKIKVNLSDGLEGVKSINLEDLYKLNPDLPDIDIYIYNSEKYSEWIQKERKIWEELMINKIQLTLNNTNKTFNIIRI